MTWLRKLALAHGAHAYPQEELADHMRRKLAGVPDGEQASQVVGFVYGHSGIRRRFFEVELAEIARRRDWYRLVNEASHAMAARALTALFGDDLPASVCDALIVVSSSFAGFPALSRRLQEQFAIPVEAPCWDLAALGCAGPTQGLAMAQALIDTGAAHNVCLVCVDAFGTHGEGRRHTRAPSMAQLVAHCLASDGAAALVVGRDPGPSPRLGFTGCRLVSRLWPGSLDQNDFTADEDNQPLISVGKDIRTRIGEELAKVLDEEALRSPLLVHPGGAALMRLLKERYPVLAPTADLSMSVLAEHGNLGAPSVLFVLDRALERGLPLGPQLRLLALGPGIVTTMAVVDGVTTG